MKANKKIEFSKFIYIFNIIFVTVVVIISFIVLFLSGKLEITDLSPISTIITVAFAELGVHSGLYTFKARSENILKIGKQIEKDKINLSSLKAANALANGLDVDDIIQEYSDTSGMRNYKDEP